MGEYNYPSTPKRSVVQTVPSSQRLTTWSEKRIAIGNELDDSQLFDVSVAFTPINSRISQGNTFSISPQNQSELTYIWATNIAIETFKNEFHKISYFF